MPLTLRANVGDYPDTAPSSGLWELRHARRRGSESSYRHQRQNQFFPIFIDEESGLVVEAGASIPMGKNPSFHRKRGLRPIWPIDSEGNPQVLAVHPRDHAKVHRRWPGGSRTIQQQTRFLDAQHMVSQEPGHEAEDRVVEYTSRCGHARYDPAAQSAGKERNLPVPEIGVRGEGLPCHSCREQEGRACAGPLCRVPAPRFMR